jgi:hypothetical protein
MGWIKNVLLDLAVVAVIFAAVVLRLEWARWVVLIYTPFMILLKLVGLRSIARIKMPTKKTVEVAPAGFYHALYGVNVALLLYGQWWIVAAGWIVIWVLSYLHQRRESTSSAS